MVAALQGIPHGTGAATATHTHKKQTNKKRDFCYFNFRRPHPSPGMGKGLEQAQRTNTRYTHHCDLGLNFSRNNIEWTSRNNFEISLKPLVHWA